MTEWQPPKDPGKFAAWAENFIEQLPKFAKELGISPDEINEFAGGLTEWKTEHVRGQLALLQMLRERLEKVQRENQWHPLFTNAFARTPVTREPGRSEMLRLLAKWIVGMEQTRGAGTPPAIACSYYRDGIKLVFSIPPPCTATALYYRRKGRGTWALLFINTQPQKNFALQQLIQEPAYKDLPGEMMEFVAFGCTETKPIGPPSKITQIRAPKEFPVPGAPAR
jgi:hypothetical protein